MDSRGSVHRRSLGLVEVSAVLVSQAAAARKEARRLRVEGVRLRTEHQRLRWESRLRRRRRAQQWDARSSPPTFVGPWSNLEWGLLPPDDIRPPLELVH